jgi:hypothetical protein
MSLLESINDKGYIDPVKILIKECERGNRWVVELN